MPGNGLLNSVLLMLPKTKNF